MKILREDYEDVIGSYFVEADAFSVALTSTAKTIREYLKPPPRLSVSEWSEGNIELPDTSAEQGPIRFDRTPYLREIADSASDPNVRRVVWMKPTQVGASTALLCIMGYFIDQDPSPILLVQISTGEAEKFSKERIAKIIDSSSTLREKVAAPRSRHSNNTINSKDFPGGHLGIVGANAPSGLRSRPRRVLLFDEVDGYPASAGAEGDPIELARKRHSTFWNSLEVLVSTPTLKDLSRIEDALNECDEIRDYWVPCPHCDELQTLKWGGKNLPYGIKWDRIPVEEAGELIEDDVVRGEIVHRCSSAAYLCEHCGVLIEERYKNRMLRDEVAGGTAEWRAEDPRDRPTRVGFRLNGLYSPWDRWRAIVREFVDAQGNPQKLQVWVNTRLGETWDQAGHSVEPKSLIARREEYDTEPLPSRVVVLTAGVDVQEDRLEMEIVGWAPDGESWSLEYLRVPGDPTTQALWDQLAMILEKRTYEHPLGIPLRISATCVDSQYQTQEVLKFAKPRNTMNVWPIQGVDGPGRPIMGNPTRRNKLKVPKYPVGVDSAKSQLYGRLAILRPEDWEEGDPIPGFCHFPKRPPYDEEYFRQLTSEKVVLRQTSGNQLKRLWVRRPGRRAETLDCRVYATAALEGLIMQGWRLDIVEQALKDAAAEADAPEASPSRSDQGSNWAYGWKS